MRELLARRTEVHPLLAEARSGRLEESCGKSRLMRGKGRTGAHERARTEKAQEPHAQRAEAALTENPTGNTHR